MDVSISLIPALMRMAVEVLVECCKQTDCHCCQLCHDDQCFFENFQKKVKNSVKNT